MIFFKIINKLKQQIVCMICCFSLVATAQYKDLTPQVEVSVMTCGAGDDLYALFGHTALRFYDPSQQIDVVFNYGMFDFDTPNFYAKFVKGDLLYKLDVDRYSDFISYYTYKERTVIEQKLNLTFEQKEDIWFDLWNQLQTEERYYQYQFIRNNCTTKVANVITKHSNYTFNTSFEGNDLSYRELLNQYLQLQYFAQLGVNIIFGKDVDQLNNLLFLPEQFMSGISYTKGIEKSKEIKFQSNVDRYNKLQWGKWLFFICIPLIIYFSNKKWVRNSYYILIGLIGVLIAFLHFYSLHTELHYNAVFLLFNPLYLIFAIKNFQKKGFFSALTILSLLGLCFLSVETLTILLPLLLLHFLVLLREWKSYKKISL